MQCHICDNQLKELKFERDGKIKPCPECIGVIAETVREYDNPKVETIGDALETDQETGFGPWGMPEFIR